VRKSVTLFVAPEGSGGLSLGCFAIGVPEIGAGDEGSQRRRYKRAMRVWVSSSTTLMKRAAPWYWR